MNSGLLWFDNDSKRELVEKVQLSVAHYMSKYGHKPNVCFVHPALLNGNGKRPKPIKAGGIEIRPGRAILPDHFWLGVAEEAR